MKNRIVTHFTDRLGGTSESPYTSCNLGLHVGDDPERVIANRDLVGTALGLPLDTWVAGEQVHGATVTVVTAEMKGRGARDLASMLPATDALITNVSGVTLTTYAADCVPILFGDPVAGAIGVAHAGWKGTVLKIAGATVQALHSTYGCDPANLEVKIGPSIGPCCYEVDERVADQVRQAFPADADKLLLDKANGHYMLDLWLANELALLEAGVRQENISRADRCTSCQADQLFSHRKDCGKTGRQAGIIALLQEN